MPKSKSQYPEPPALRSYASETPRVDPAASKRRSNKKRKPPTLKRSHQLVTLFAGSSPEAKSILIHKDFATYHSPVLKAAFDSDFFEGQNQEYHFDNDFGINVITLLAEFFYTQKIDLSQLRWNEAAVSMDTSDSGNTIDEDMSTEIESSVDEDGNSITSENSEDTNNQLYNNQSRCLCQLWILADQMLIPKLQNLALQKLNDISEKSHTIPDKLCRYVYQNTLAGSALRKWFVWIHCFEHDKEDFERNPELFPHAMLMDMVKLFSTTFLGPEDGDGETVDKDITIFMVPEDGDE